ncbi:MAG: hypothetical protein IPK00_12985 [Deltaproteobacteria bacterium]|nr:hypothetical protein [Deltaproteobacteria bacterium]
MTTVTTTMDMTTTTIRRPTGRGTTIRKRAYGALAVASAAASIALSATSASAQAVDIPAILDADLKAPPTAVVLQYGHQFGADVADGGGPGDKQTKLARDTAFFGLAHRFRLGERTTLFAIGNYTLHAYDFSGGRNATNRYQWDRVHRGVVSGIVGHELGDHWRILGGGLVRTWGETGAKFEDTLTGGLLGGFDYHPNDDFSVGLLVGAISKLDGGVGLLPVPTLKWKFAEAWRLNVGMVQLVDPGVGAQINYQLTPGLGLGAGFTYQSRQFRLSDARRAQGSTRPSRTDDGGVGQETEIPVFATLRWKPTPTTELDLNGGVAVRGNLRVEDEDGGRIADDDYEPAGILALKGQIFF